jgi:hypothetical protein
MNPTIDISLLDANGDTVIVRPQGLEGDYLEAQPGKGQTIPFYTKQEDLVVSSGETYTVESGTWEYFSDVTIESGGTLDVNGTLVAVSITNDGTLDNDGVVINGASKYAAYNRVNDLIDAAGNGTVELDYQGVPAFQDIVRPQANVNSMVIKVEGVDLPEFRDFWAFVTDGSNDTTILGAKEDLQLETTVIAPVDEYGDRTTLENAVEVSGLQF